MGGEYDQIALFAPQINKKKIKIVCKSNVCSKYIFNLM